MQSLLITQHFPFFKEIYAVFKSAEHIIAKRIAFTNQTSWNFCHHVRILSSWDKLAINRGGFYHRLTSDIRSKRLTLLRQVRAISTNDIPLSRAVPQIDAVTSRASIRSSNQYSSSISNLGRRLLAFQAQSFFLVPLSRGRVLIMEHLSLTILLIRYNVYSIE